MSLTSHPGSFPTVTPAHISNPGLASSPSNTPSAFKVALDKHLEKLKSSEKLAFNEAYNSLTADGLLASVRAFDEKHCKTSFVQRCSPAITKCFMVLNELLRSTTICIQSNPEISALVVGGIRLLVDIAVKYVTFFPKLTNMISQLSEYLAVLQSYVDRLDREPEKNAHLIQQCAANLYGDWLDFCTEARSVFVDKKGVHRRWASIRIFLRVQWDPFEARLGQIQADFQQNLDLLLHSTQATQFHDIRSGLAQIQSARSDHETREAASTRKDFMHWISALDFDDDHERISSRKHPGTGNWLIQRSDFQSWMNGSSSRLLWCYGKPGSGKSVLASHVLEDITTKAALDSHIGIAFCYFNYKQADNQKPRQILSAFIKQLCYDRQVLPPRLLDFYRKHLLNARAPSYDAVRDALAVLADEFSEIYFVIDALDECEQDMREKIIEAVVEITRDHRCVKAFITSRLETDIENLFRSLQTPTVCIQARNTADDIRMYVNDSVKTLMASKKLRIQDDQTRLKIIQTLVQKADGMFLWVFLQLQSLCRQRSDRDILHELNNLPSDLYETYRRILSVIEELPPALQSLAQRSLMLVFYAARPLRMVELIDLAAVAAGSDQMQRSDMNRYSSADILEACANLLSEDEAVVRPSHFSVQEYFSSPRTITDNPGLSKYFISPAEGHTQIVTACLRYLSFGFLRGGVCATEFSLNLRLQNHPCARYAAQYFDYHLAILNKIPGDLRMRLEAFLSQPERSLASTLQFRRLRHGSHSGLIRGEFDTVQWPANAGTVIESTGLSGIHGIRSKNPCWYEQAMPYALHQACYGGSPHTVKRLIDSGHDPHKTDQRGNTPLFYAARGGHLEICRMLSEPQLYADSVDHRNALRAALDHNHEAVVRVLLLGFGRQGIECLKEQYHYSWAVLAFGGYEHILKRTLETTIISADADSTMFSALIQAACYEPHMGTVRMLFEKYCMKSFTPKFGSALHICCEYGHFELAQLLLEHGATVQANRLLEEVDLPHDISKCHTSRYYLPLQIAVATKSFMLVKLLLENGADANGGSVLDNDKPLSIAVREGLKGVVQLLLKYGAKFYDRPLQLAIAAKNHWLVNLLLEKGADVNGHSILEDETPLNMATRGGSVIIVRLLLQYGAKNHDRPLQVAIAAKNFELIGILLENADVF